MTQSQPRRFSFDASFDGPNAAAPRYKRAYSPDEVEAIRAEAYAEGQSSAAIRAEQETAAAMGVIAQCARQAIATLSETVHRHRSESARLALAAGRAIAGAALERFPEAPLTDALSALSRELEGEPRILVQAAAHDPAMLEARLHEAAARAGLEGRIVFQPQQGGHPSSFSFDWGGGKAEFDPEAAARRVAEALETALAVEGHHAEATPNPEFEP
jgi:flagellar assembly protein FliH